MKQQKQSGFAHLVIIIVLAVALVGTLGFVFYQNVIQKKDNVVKTDGSSKDADKNNKSSDDDNDAVVDPNKGYLVLDDWGVKFKSPSNLGDNQITYRKDTMEYWGEYYGFSTKRLDALSQTSAVELYRLTDPIGEAPSAPSLAGVFGGYYYYIRKPQQNPYYGSGNNANAEIFDTDSQIIIKMLESVENK
ncbi:MAG: hypothetical protein WCK26_02900 [Candidatus Saccharibacteria bacterium]